MKKTLFSYSAAVILLISLPLAGAFLDGKALGQYLEFPPLTRYVAHAGFSKAAFGLLTAFFLITACLVWRTISFGRKNAGPPDHRPPSRFPWWGWIGIFITLSGWFLAWTRFDWLGQLQHHTFLPLWFGYILTVNGLCVKRTAGSLLTDTPRRFALLFPLSAVFWWFFEYLNRFVQNWYYLNVEHFSVAQYIIFATLSFSTVLPAVLSTTRLLLTFQTFETGLKGFHRVRIRVPRIAATTILLLSGVGLSLLAVFPDILFPLLWLSPLLIIVSIQTLNGQQTLFSPLARGDWRMVPASAMAALICGFFWELWNAGSLAKWKYAIPYVNCCHIFEMPILGYLGYLPFGLECVVVGAVIVNVSKLLPENE